MKHRKDMEYTLSKVYNLIEKNILENGCPPTMREIMKEMSVASTSTVKYYLDKLEERNLIKRLNNKSRGIELVNKSKLNIKDNSHIKEVPLLGDVAAGKPIFAIENYDEIYEISDNLFNIKCDVFMLKVKGESMINAGILNGDIILVRKQNYADNTEIVVAMIDGEVTVKRFYKEKNRVRLQPENDFMEPIYTDNVEILGKVIGLIRHI